ncbi:hypothetical protein GJU43_18435 [Flavobacterium sp. LC2016-23]|uniref:hypothetical protein n=1 Tax=Flavobacterium sp. LC2016-23 TaxID=2666330 RepID=UPI0012B04C5B|nr:hypothetical protein [Flavobacterium sp. LC2016-23]MRX41270.1 hypothetical protein [Flavobacterium sp. LC2016-23]
MAVISSVIIGIVFLVDLLLAHYELKFILINLFFVGITSLLVWFWNTLNKAITAIYMVNQQQHIGLSYWPSIFRCLILLAIGYLIIILIGCYGLVDRLLSGTALLG